MRQWTTLSVTLGEKWNVKTGLLLVKEKKKKISDALATVYLVVKNERAGRGIERQEGSGRPRKQLVRLESLRLTHFRNYIIE